MGFGNSPFFADPQRLLVFEEASIRMRTVIENYGIDAAGKHMFMLEFVSAAFYYIKTYPEAFDERCVNNIRSLGERYVNSAKNMSFGSGPDQDDLGFLFGTSYRFLLEYQVNTPGSVMDELSSLLSKVHDYEYQGSVRLQLKYAEHQMLIGIVKGYIHHPNMINLAALPEQLARAEEERERSSVDLSAREERVQSLKEKLESYETAFNFCGLYEGFKKLRDSKKIEGWIGLAVLVLLAVLMMLPFFVKFYLSFHPVSDIGLDVQFYVALLGFELVLAYFFRVALHNFRSIKAQLIQIDLRMTLCQFVQDYARYAKEVNEGGHNLLERFEQIIFSGIVNDEGAIPSTFDGLDHLASMIGKLKK